MRPHPVLLLLLPVLLLSACGSREADPWVVTHLYLGTEVPGGGTVDEGALARFIDGAVAEAFPDGLTRYEATGQWRGANGHPVHERTVVIEVVHHRGDAAAAAVTTLAKDYRERFHQEAVLVTEGPLDGMRLISR